MRYSTEPLFVTPPTYRGLTKQAAITLSRDGDDWERQISDALHREHPFIHEHDIAFHLTRTDPQTGVGVGSIRIDSKVLVPLVIDRFKLAPLDLFWHQGELRPLTRDSLESALQDVTLGKPVTPGQGETTDVSLYGRTQPPFDGKYTYAGLLKASAAGRKDVVRSVEAAFGSRDEAFAALREASPVLNVLRSMQEAPAPAAPTARPRLVKRAAAAADLRPLAEAGLWRVHGSDAFERNVLLFDHHVDAGLRRTGAAVAVGVDKEAGYFLFTPGADVSGRRLAGMDKFAQLDYSASTPRGAGFFVKFAAKGGVACGPFRVEHYNDDCATARTASGEIVTLTKSAEVRRPCPVDGGIVFPSDWAWLPAAAPFAIAKTAAAVGMRKRGSVDGAVRRAGPRLVVRGLDGFRGDGDVAEKVAAELKSRFDADSVDALLRDLPDAAEAEFAVECAPVVKRAAKAVAARDLLIEATYVRPCREFSFPFGGSDVKIAAVTDDDAARTVDALLGLNFLNPENLYRFAEKVDLLAEARTAVAKLLLASRLGLGVDSRPLRTAMFALDAVERDLRELQNSIEIPEMRGS